MEKRTLIAFAFLKQFWPTCLLSTLALVTACGSPGYDGTTPLPEEQVPVQAAVQQQPATPPADTTGPAVTQEPIAVPEQPADEFADTQAVQRRELHPATPAATGGGANGLMGEYLTGMEMQNELDRSAAQGDAAAQAVGRHARDRVNQIMREQADRQLDAIRESDTGYADDFKR